MFEYNELMSCKKCNLCQIRKQVVPGIGNIFSKIMFVGEAPGIDEDDQGIPFCGKSGKLVDKFIKFLGLDKKWVYVTNIVKCIPKDKLEDRSSRKPTEEEILFCMHYLNSEISSILPDIIVTFGSVATEYLMHKPISITTINGSFQEISKYVCKLYTNRKPIFPVVHPSFVLRNSIVGKPLFLKAGNILKKELERIDDEIPF